MSNPATLLASSETPAATPSPTPVKRSKPKIITLLDLSTVNVRPNFRRIEAMLSNNFEIVRGYHVTAHPQTINMEKVAHNLPESFVPIYKAFEQTADFEQQQRARRILDISGEATEDDEESMDVESAVRILERQRASRAAAMSNASMEAALRILNQILSDQKEEIQELHAIINSDIYVALIEHVRQAGLRVHMYTPNKHLLRYADDFMPWADFEQEYTFQPNRGNRNEQQ